MGNAAQMKNRGGMKVHLEFTDGRTLSSECGTFTYQSDPSPNGPLIIHLLKLPDRGDKENEPIAIFSKVASFRTDEIDAPELPKGDETGTEAP